MKSKRIFSVVISLVLVVCLMTSISPIKAEAATVTGGITGWQAFLFLISASAGVLFNAEIPTEPPAIIEYAEQSLDNFVVENYEFYFPDSDPDDDDDTDLQEFWDDLKESVNKCFDETGSFQTLDEFLSIENHADWVYAKKKLALANPAIGIGSKLDKLIAEWYVDLYEKGFFEFIANPEGNGSSFYNEWLLPDMPTNWDPSEYPYATVFAGINDDGTMSGHLYASDIPFLGYPGETGRLHGNNFLGETIRYQSWVLNVNSDLLYSWGPVSSSYLHTAQQTGPFINGASIVYTNYDFVSYTDGAVILPASPPISKSYVTAIEPDLFFGDYAEQNENGTLTADSFVFPEYDFSDYIYSKDSIQDQIMQTYDQISNGQMSYDDYMESITYDDSYNDNVGGDSSETPGGSNGTYDDYIAGKMNALAAKFPLVDSILATANDLKAFLSNLGQKPPIIYIDLGASRGPYDIGGKVPFIDLTWYAEYKPTMDSILSAFLWLWFAWRMFLSLPGILHGSSGLWHFSESHAGQASSPIGTFNDKSFALNSSYDPTYEELLDIFFDGPEVDDWLPGEYEYFRAHPPTYEELLEMYHDPLSAPD